MRRIALPLIVTAALVASLPEAFPPARAEGTTFLVNTIQDDLDDPPAGSLRQALLDAQAGDTIEFVQGLVITLDDHLLVDTYLDDLTIRGPVTLRSPGPKDRRELSVSSNRVTIQDVTFQDVEFLTNRTAPSSSFYFGPDDLTVTGCAFQGSARLILQSGSRARISGNTIFYDHFPADTAFVVFTTRDAVIEDNEVHTASTDDQAFSDTYSIGVTVRGNLLGGNVFLQCKGGEFAGNQVLGEDGMLVYYADAGADRGRLVIDDNDLRRLNVTRTDVAITGNRVGVGVGPGSVKGGDIRMAVNSFDPKGGTGPVEIRGNTVEGGIVGIQLLYSKKKSSPAVLADNEVSGASLLGINAALPPGVAAVTGNTLVQCGGTLGRTRGAALALVPPVEGGILEVSGNLVQGGGADGIYCATKGRNPADVLFQDNRVEGVGGNGIVLSGKSLVVSSMQDAAVGCGESGLSLERGALVVAASLETSSSGGPGVFCGKKCSLELQDGEVSGNGAGGVHFQKRSQGSVFQCAVEGNAGAGVFVESKAKARVQLTTTAGNGGPGIDLFPAGFSDNKTKKKANSNLPYPEEMEVEIGTGQLVGLSEPGAQIEVYASETGEGGHGGAVEFLGAVVADGSGWFRYPAEGVLECPEGGFVTVTATLEGIGAVTSEYSENVPCDGAGGAEIVSLSHDGLQGDGDSLLLEVVAGQAAGRGWVSDDGRRVVFRSRATNLPIGDTNGGRDVFVRDREAESTLHGNTFPDGTPSSVSDSGSHGPGDHATISGNGRYVVFQSDEADFDENAFYEGGSGFGNTYRKDLETGEIVAIGPHYYPDFSSFGPGAAEDCSVNADGALVAFVSNTKTYLGQDENLEPIDSNNATDVFVTLVGSAQYVRVSESTAGDEGTAPAGQGAAACRSPRISADGRYVAFLSYLDGLVAGVSTGTTQEFAFVHDLTERTTVLGSADGSGSRVRATELALSDDGRHLAFASFVDGVVPEDADGKTDIFVRHLDGGATELASVARDGESFTGTIDQPAISGDGRFVLFRHRTNTFNSQIWLRDMEKGVTELVSLGAGGPGNGNSITPDITPDGRYVVFASVADDLVEGDANLNYDVFLVDRGPQDQE